MDYVHVTKTQKLVHHFTLKQDDLDAAMRVVDIATRSMTRLLSVSVDIEEIAGLLTPDLDDWMWDSAEKEAARNLWRIK